MSPCPADVVFPPRVTGPFRVAFLGSLAVHVLASMLWTSTPPSGVPGGAILHVTLVSGDVATVGSVPRQAISPSEPEFAASEDVSERVAPVETAMESDALVRGAREILAVAGGDSPPLSNAQAGRRHEAHQTEVRPPAEGPPRSSVELKALPARSIWRLEQVDESRAREPEQVAFIGSAPDGVRDEEIPSPGASPVDGQDGGAGGDTYQALQAALHEALLPRLDYPLLARRRGWEGRVRVGLVVESDGDLRAVHVVESSGFKVLDRAAVKDLKEVGTLTAVAGWLEKGEMTVTLPVQYRLR